MQKRFLNILFKGLIAAIFIYSVYMFFSLQPLIDQRKEELAQLEQEIAKISQQNMELRKQILLSDTDAAIERKAREILGLIYPHEKVFVDVNE